MLQTLTDAEIVKNNKRAQKLSAFRVRSAAARLAKAKLGRFGLAVRQAACDECDATLCQGPDGTAGSWGDGTGYFIEVDGMRLPPAKRVKATKRGMGAWGRTANVTGAASNPKRPTRADWHVSRG